MLLAVVVSLATMMPTMTMAAATTRAVTTTHEAISPRSSAEMQVGSGAQIGAQEAEGRPDRFEGGSKDRAHRCPAPFSVLPALLRVGDVGRCHGGFLSLLGGDQIWLPVKAARAG